MQDKVLEMLKTIFPAEIQLINEFSSVDNIPSWDSLKQMKVILEMEEYFNVEVPDELAAELTSVKLIVEFLDEYAQ